MNRSFSIFLLFFLLLLGCTSSDANAKQQNQSKRSFPFVDVPLMINEETAQIKYLRIHFWDKFDFSDESWLKEEDELKRAMFAYLNILSIDFAKETSIESLKQTLQKSSVSPAMELFFTESLYSFLADPNSPLRNEDLQLVLLDFVLASENSNDVDLSRATFDRELLMKNRPGTPAADFSFTLENGRSQRLYSVNAYKIILMFYNPDCDACAYTIDYLKNSAEVKKLIAENKLKILAIYPDKDLTAWEKYKQHIPSEWINGYDKDQKLEKELLYDLKAIPTLYLLDSDKKVLLKDAPVEAIVANL